MSEVLISFNGSMANCFGEAKKASSYANTPNQSVSPSRNTKKGSVKHPKVNLPFFRHNRKSKIKVFNLKQKSRKPPHHIVRDSRGFIRSDRHTPEKIHNLSINENLLRNNRMDGLNSGGDLRHKFVLCNMQK